MKTAQLSLAATAPAIGMLAPLQGVDPHLVLVFGCPRLLERPEWFAILREAFPAAVLAGCSTAGEIGAGGAVDGSLVLTAVRFDTTRLQLATTMLDSMADSFAAGARLGASLRPEQLRTVLLFGQGVHINGSALIEGLAAALPPGVPISGGLAGDGSAFVRTLTLSTHATSDRQLVAVGLYGEQLRMRHGSFHGWEPFGPARRVTRAHGNLLFELDGMPALDVYRRYLGEEAAGLPAAALLFPFEMLGPDRRGRGLIRTILGIDEAAGSLVLAGDIVPDGYLRLMHASIDSLVSGAHRAAEHARSVVAEPGDSLALLVSCVGRKLVMGIRADEEVEAVTQVLGSAATVAGFYAYGEIGPFSGPGACQLHNQTMSITHLGEAPFDGALLS